MGLHFEGASRLQRGQGIGGILRALKSVFTPMLRSAGRTAVKAATSSTGKAIGSALRDQAINTATNLTVDALRGNDMSHSLQNELDMVKNKAANTIENASFLNKSPQKNKKNKKAPKKTPVKNKKVNKGLSKYSDSKVRDYLS